MVVMPGGERLVDLRGRQEVHVQRRSPPAVRILPSPEITSVRRADDEVGVDAVGDVGVAGAAERDDPAVADADVGPDDAPVVEDDRVGDDGVSAPSARVVRALGHRLADRLAAAEDRLLAAEGEVLLDLDPQVGVAEPDLVADGRAVERGVLAPRSSSTIEPHLSLPDLDARDTPAARAARRRRPRGTRRARTAATCRTGCRAGTRAPRPGRSPAPRWRRAGAGASRSGPAGRRC